MFDQFNVFMLGVADRDKLLQHCVPNHIAISIHVFYVCFVFSALTYCIF